MQPEVRKSFISMVEKGAKENLDARSVGRFIMALDLDQSWIDRFLGVETTEDSDETRAEREADGILQRLEADPDVPEAS